MKYPVEIIDGVFGESPVLADLVADHRVLIVADNNVVQHVPDIGTKIGTYVRDHAIRLAGTPVVMQGGERVKLDGLQSPLAVVKAILEQGLAAEDFVLAIGGGTVLDVAGWAAAQANGGVGLIRMPTTPLAMMGAAFAEYAAVDQAKAKDALRIPSTPAAVLIDPSFAQSVLDGVWRGGLTEAVRLAADKDAKSLSKLADLVPAYRQRDAAAFAEVVSKTVALRQKKGPSALGLAFAAELEPKSEWKLPYGYAVAIGLLVDLYRSVKDGTRKASDLEACKGILGACGVLEGAGHSKHLLPPELADFW